MSDIQFRHPQNKRKTWLIPLIIIILLYLSIPVLLINKGNDSFEKAISAMENNLIQAGNYYNSGIIFTDLAGNFPGFSAWAKKTALKGKEEIINSFKRRCEELKNKNIEVQSKFCKDSKTFIQKTKIQVVECEDICK